MNGPLQQSVSSVWLSLAHIAVLHTSGNAALWLAMAARRVDERDTTAVQETDRLDLAEFGRMLRERRGSLSIRQAAADAGVSFSTMSRVEAGAHPDLATFTRLCAWLRVSPARFFTPVTERRRTPLEEAVTHLRADPRLSTEAWSKISSVLTDLYDALATDAAVPKAVVACHLRAASVMRPGVPPRMAALLSDMQQELIRQVEAGEL